MRKKISMSSEPSNEINPDDLEKILSKYMTLLEEDLGQDIIPITIILMCRVSIKYSLNIDWVLSTIYMGYQNEVPPDIVTERGRIKYDS